MLFRNVVSRKSVLFAQRSREGYPLLLKVTQLGKNKASIVCND